MLPLLGLLGLAGMGLLLGSGCSPKLPAKNTQDDARDDGKKIAQLAWKRLQRLEPRPQLDSGCARLRLERHQSRLQFLGKGNGSIEACELHSYLAVHPELFPDLTLRLFPAGKVPWDLGQKRKGLQSLVGRVQTEISQLGMDLQLPDTQRKQVKLLWLLTQYEILKPWEYYYGSGIKHPEYEKHWKILTDDLIDFPLPTLFYDLKNGLSFLNLNLKESKNLDPKHLRTVPYLFFLALYDSGLDPRFDFIHDHKLKSHGRATGHITLPIPSQISGPIGYVEETFRRAPWVERDRSTGAGSYELTARQYLGWYLTQLSRSELESIPNRHFWLAAASELYPEFPEPYALRAQLHIDQKEYAHAADLLKTAARLAPEHVAYDKKLAIMRIKQFVESLRNEGEVPDMDVKWIDEVIHRLNLKLREAPHDQEIYDLLGHCHAMKIALPLDSLWAILNFDLDGNLETLLPYFKQAIQGGSNQELPYLGVGLYLLRRNPRDPEGIELILEGIRRSRYSAPITGGMATALFLMNREHLLSDQALKFLESHYTIEFGALPSE